MPAASKRSEIPANHGDPTLLDALSDAVESGAGLPAVARAIGQAAIAGEARRIIMSTIPASKLGG